MKSEAEVLAEYRSKAAARLAQATSDITKTLSGKAQIKKHPKKSLALGAACVFGMALAVRKTNVVQMGRKAAVVALGIAGRMFVRRALIPLSAPPSTNGQTPPGSDELS